MPAQDEPQAWTSPAAADAAEGWLLLHALYITLQRGEHLQAVMAVMAEVRRALIKRGHVVDKVQDVNANSR